MMSNYKVIQPRSVSKDEENESEQEKSNYVILKIGIKMFRLIKSSSMQSQPAPVPPVPATAVPPTCLKLADLKMIN